MNEQQAFSPKNLCQFVAATILTAILSPVAKGEILDIRLVGDGMTSPVGASHAGDGSGRVFVVDQIGQVRLLSSIGLHATPYLDVSSDLVSLNSFDERGLLSISFHPDFENNGKFYTYRSQPVDGAADFTVPLNPGSSFNHQAVITEYTADDPNSNVFSGSSREILRIDEPQGNHNGGQTAFGPDGFLYIGLGDGGGSNDVGNGHTAGIGNGQDLSNVLGSILRIDVNGSDSANGEYGIPDNPFVSNGGAVDEIYAYGVRNPWRFSFDDGPGGTGRLFVGDVGQGLFEEINLVGEGDDLGWNVKEGFHLFDPSDPSTVTPDPGGTLGPNGETLIDPILEYQNTNNPNVQLGDPNGRAVVSGYVYRDDNPDLTHLVGKFIFGDWSRSFGVGDGSVFIAEETAPGVFTMEEAMVDFGDGVGPQRLNRFLFAFGKGEEGQIYLLTNTTGGPTGTTGQIYLITPEPSTWILAWIGLLPMCAFAWIKRRRVKNTS